MSLCGVQDVMVNAEDAQEESPVMHFHNPTFGNAKREHNQSSFVLLSRCFLGLLCRLMWTGRLSPTRTWRRMAIAR